MRVDAGGHRLVHELDVAAGVVDIGEAESGGGRLKYRRQYPVGGNLTWLVDTIDDAAMDVSVGSYVDIKVDGAGPLGAIA